MAFGGEFSSRFNAEELHNRGNAGSLCYGGDVCGRFHAKDGNILLLEVLQQITVVAGDLDDLAGAIQPETVNHRVDIHFGVSKPTVSA